MQIDHFMWGAPSLETGIEKAVELFGVRAQYGGPHVGMGTHNALLSLGEQVYLEIIAPDPAQSTHGKLATALATLEECGLISWAAACSDLSTLKTTLAAQQVTAAGPLPTKRETPAGELLEWELLIPTRHELGSGVPFFIDWLACPHPAQHNPVAGQFNKLRIESPNASGLSGLFEAIGLSIEVRQASTFQMSVDITSLNDEGPVQLKTTSVSGAIALA